LGAGDGIVANTVAKKAYPGGILLRTWTNTDPGEDWEEKGDGLAVEALDRSRAKIAPDTCPDWVLVKTCGVDVQDDRIELEIVGWDDGFQSFSLDYGVLHGDTTCKDVWDQLDEQLGRRF
jgi:phage terminase large subunit GpA-like protein